jgi:hypothetical protein
MRRSGRPALGELAVGYVDRADYACTLPADATDVDIAFRRLGCSARAVVFLQALAQRIGQGQAELHTDGLGRGHWSAPARKLAKSARETRVMPPTVTVRRRPSAAYLETVRRETRSTTATSSKVRIDGSGRVTSATHSRWRGD